MFKRPKHQGEGKELGGAFRPTNIPLAASPMCWSWNSPHTYICRAHWYSNTNH